MTNITFIGHSGICPQWKVDITVRAKYRYTENPDNAYEAVCTHCVICPILENIKLPRADRIKEYELYPFCRMKQDCELMNYPFKEVIDVSKDDHCQ